MRERVIEPWKPSWVELNSALSSRSICLLPTISECRVILRKNPHFTHLIKFVNDQCYGCLHSPFNIAWMQMGPQDYLRGSITFEGIELKDAINCLRLVITSYDLDSDYKELLIPVLIGCWFKIISWFATDGSRVTYMNREIGVA